MKKQGTIRLIENKVMFEYYLLEKPIFKDYTFRIDGIQTFTVDRYNRAMEKYEASKQEVEVSNIMEISNEYDVYERYINISKPYPIDTESIKAKDGQKCEAEVTSKTATIIKIN